MTSRGGGGGGGGGGRDRARREYSSSRFEDKPHSGRPKAPPSRHLWVGNLSHNIVERDLTDHLLRFGELDSVAFQQGRSYAFINFRNEDEAFAAMKALQGFPLAGNPLRIEFAKADKSSTQSHDEGHLQRRDEQRSALRDSPFSQRDSRARHSSPDPYYPEKSKMSDKDVEPSEVLWIGFPSLLKVDETILKKAFSPFGEVEKITVFPGRSYAFVRFRTVMSACRAKETLQGKLFGNPRVHICFARSEAGSSNSGRSSISAPLSPHFNSNAHPSENFRQDRNFGSLLGDPRMRSPLLSNLDSGDSDMYNFGRKGTSWTGENDEFEHGWFGESDLGPPPDKYECRSSPPRERSGLIHDFPGNFPQKHPIYDDPWDLPEDAYLHGAKKLKTSSFPPDKELPDYPFSHLDKEKHAFARPFSDFPQPEPLDRSFEPGTFGYKQIPNQPKSLPLPNGERSDHWKASYDNFPTGSFSLPENPVERRRFTPESDQSSMTEWKWEGTIAKGGTPVCRARCFPVGKVLDIMLPEFLDCTARTGLDMLAKHYYQAAGAWVVFFVPESDADMVFYNEFMHYLGEKQRAAVAKLDDKTTLFLVPPSDFSEKVLKVPGKLSISGVILRLEQPNSNIGSLYHPKEQKDVNSLPFHRDPSYLKPSKPSGPFPPMPSYSDTGKPGASTIPFLGNAVTSTAPTSFLGSAHSIGNVSNPYNENRHGHPFQRNPTAGSNWSPHHQQNSISGASNISQMPNSALNPIIQEHHSVGLRAVQNPSSSHNTSGILGNPLSGNSRPSLQDTQPVSLSMPVAGLKPEQLAQLASSLLGQQRQPVSTANVPVGEDSRQVSTMDQSDNPYRTPQRYGLQNNQVTSELPMSQFGQVQQLQQQQQMSNAPAVPPHTVQRDLQAGVQGNQQLQSTGSTQEEDPQKRLQATLQLAAALLQQIQQGKGT